MATFESIARMPKMKVNTTLGMRSPSTRFFVERRALADNLSRLSLKNESDLLTSLKYLRVINPAFHDQVSSLKDITAQMISRTVTTGRLEEAARIFEGRTGSATETEKFASLLNIQGIGNASGRAADVTNIIWGIRDSLAEARLTLLSGQTLLSLIEDKKEANLTVNRMTDMTGALLTLSWDRLESGTNIREEALEEISASKRAATEYFLSSSKDLLSAMSSDFTGIREIFSKKRFLTDATRFSEKEEAIYKESEILLAEMRDGKIADGEARERILKLLSEIEGVPRGKSKEALYLQEFIDNVKFMINKADDIAAGKGSKEDFSGAISNTAKVLEGRLRKMERGAYYWLIPLSTAAVLISTAYVVYRVSNLMTPGYPLSSYVAAVALIAAEIFYASMSIITNIGVVHSLIKTKGANGLSWLPELRKKLPDDPEKRESAALFLASFNEPIQCCLDSTKHAIRAVWNYGNASLKMLDDSVHLSNHFGILGSLRNVKMMTAKKEIYRTLAREAGVTDKNKARFMANALASEGTEIDDAETRKFAVIRAAEDEARYLNIYEKKVKVFGKAVEARYPRPQDEESSLRVIRDLALRSGIARAKADYLADAVSKKFASLKRLSEISRLIDEAIRSKNAEIETRLSNTLADEFALDINIARKLVTLIYQNAQKINVLSREAMEEMDYFGNKDAREIYLGIHELMERIIYNDERENNVEVRLEEKMRQISEWRVFRCGGLLKNLLRSERWVPGKLWQVTSAIGEDLAKFISSQAPIVDAIRGTLAQNPDLKFEEAEDAVWAERFQSIEQFIGSKIKRKYDLSDEETRKLAEGVTNDLILNRNERKVATFEFAQYLANQARGKKYHEERHVESVYGVKLDGSPESILALIEKDKYFSAPGKGLSGTTAKYALIDMGINSKIIENGKEVMIAEKIAEKVAGLENDRARLINEIIAFGITQENAILLADKIIEQHKKIVLELLNVALKVNTAVKNKTIAPVKTDGTIENILIAVSALTAEANERVDFIHRLKAHKRGAKAGGINHAIHGLTISENIGEILRQIIHKRVEEQFFGQAHIPEEVLTYIDRHIVDSMPDNVDSRPEVVARQIMANAKAGASIRQQASIFIGQYYKGKKGVSRSLGKKIATAVAEINARTSLYNTLQEIAKNPNAEVKDLVKKHTKGLALSNEAVKNLLSVAAKVKKCMGSGEIKTFTGPAGRIIFSAGRPQPKDRKESEKIKFFLTGNTEIRTSALMEDVNHMVINPDHFSASELAERIISIRHIPEETIKHKENKNPIKIAGEIRKYAVLLDSAIAANSGNAVKWFQEGANIETVAERLIEAAGRMLPAEGFEKNYLAEARPEMSGLKYKFIGCFDADYRVNIDALNEVAPYFKEHSSYFFIGKRQFGRNDDEPIGKVMNNGGDAYWNFTNIENTLSNVNASWGSCVFHSTKSYMDTAKWIFNTEYNPHWQPKRIRKYAFKTYLKEKIGGLEKKIKTGKEKGQDTKLDEKILDLEKSILKLRESKGGSIAFGAMRALFSPVNLSISLVDFLYSISFMQLLDYVHERGIRGKALGRARSIKNPSADEMISSQDFTTESEDIASCLWPLRRLSFLSSSEKHPLERSGFIEGVGGQGSQPAYRDPLYNTFGGRWARGNAALFWEVMFTDLGLWRKIRYASSTLYWLTGMARLSLFASPLLYMFLGIKPIIVRSIPELLVAAIATTSVNMGAFFGLMYARGRTLRDSGRLLFLEPTVISRQAKQVYYGLIEKVKPPFKATGKKEVAQIRTAGREMPIEWGLAGLNIAGVIYSIDFAARLNGGYTGFGAAIWTAFHGTLLLYANLALNPGVDRESTLNGIKKSLKNKFIHDYPSHQTGKKLRPANKRLSEEGGDI